VASCGGAAANEERSRWHRKTLAQVHCKSDHLWSSATVRVTCSHRSILSVSHNHVLRSNKPLNSRHITEGSSNWNSNSNRFSPFACSGTEIYNCNYFAELIAYNDPCTNEECQSGNFIQNSAYKNVHANIHGTTTTD